LIQWHLFDKLLKHKQRHSMNLSTTAFSESSKQ
jgi:hypothetical protein